MLGRYLNYRRFLWRDVWNLSWLINIFVLTHIYTYLQVCVYTVVKCLSLYIRFRVELSSLSTKTFLPNPVKWYISTNFRTVALIYANSRRFKYKLVDLFINTLKFVNIVPIPIKPQQTLYKRKNNYIWNGAPYFLPTNISSNSSCVRDFCTERS